MADKEHRFSWTVLIGDALLLLCALPGLAGSFLSLYGNPDALPDEAAALEEKGIAPERIRKYGFAFEGKQVLIG